MRRTILAIVVGVIVLPALSNAQVTRFLVVGDSWAEEQWLDGSHQRVFNNNNLADLGNL